MFRRIVVALFALATLVEPCTAQAARTTSHYLQTADGTRLAVDVHLPPDLAPDRRIPALLVLTRYWRSSEDPATGRPNPALGPLDRRFIDNGYAVVKVDTRGSGASFGTRPVEYGPQEVRDGYDVVEWVVTRRWSNGRVGAYGTSYTGTTAEFLAAVNHPAVRAVIPGWSDFDLYESPVRPYGLLADALIAEWSRAVGWLDANETARMRAGVRRVDGDGDGVLLAAAVAEHAENPDVYAAARAAEYRDAVVGRAGGSAYTYDSSTSLHWQADIERSGVPMLVFASWLDAGTANGALRRFARYSNPQHLVLLASNHGGANHASPYTVGEEPRPSNPSVAFQAQLRLAFFDHHLKGRDAGVDAWPAIRYFTMGEETLHETDSWPPPGVAPARFYLRAEHRLTPTPPSERNASDRYVVDFSATTGTSNRWMTQMGGPVLNLDDRASADERMLVYTTEPLEGDVQITGTGFVSLVVESDHRDGAVLVYLEDVDPSGRSRYVTEGGLRLVHRAPSEQSTGTGIPHHTFRTADARPMVPGQSTEVSFQLWPVSVLVRAGHRLRLAIAGADADTFARLPATGTPTLTIHRSQTRTSFIELPVIER